MVEQHTQGTFIPDGRHDVLAAAFGRPEHPGRVRGIGFGVGIRDFFGRCSHGSTSSVSDRVLEQLMKKMTQEVTQNVMKQFGKTVDPSGDRCTPDPLTRVSTKGSCADVASKRSEEKTPILADDQFGFYVDESPLRLVAIGRVHEADSTLHCAPLPAHLVKVIIEEAVDADAEVPVATEEVNFVREALGGFIAWPRDLVIPNSNKVNIFLVEINY